MGGVATGSIKAQEAPIPIIIANPNGFICNSCAIEINIGTRRAALAVLEVFEEEHLLDRCKAVGERLVTGLKAIQAKHPVIGDVRALGAMIAVELFEGGDAHKPNAAAVAQVVAKAREKGLILLSCGPYGNVLRVLVPLTSPDEQLDKGLAIIEECFAELA